MVKGAPLTKKEPDFSYFSFAATDPPHLQRGQMCDVHVCVCVCVHVCVCVCVHVCVCRCDFHHGLAVIDDVRL